MAIEERDVDMQDNEEDEVQEEGGGSEAEGSEEEEEYEIEKILDSKRGVFEKGQIAFYVSWKGYGPEHNSWVKDTDAENARDLILDYWARQKAKKTGRKSLDSKAKPSSQPEPSPPPKKRSRLSKASMQVDDEDEDEEPPKEEPKKRGRKSTQNGTSKKKQVQDTDDEDTSLLVTDKIATMDQYKHIKDWEPLVESIVTVEKSEGGSILVFFTVKTPDGLMTMRENSKLCRKRFPQKLLDFYEGNLRWRSADEE